MEWGEGWGGGVGEEMMDTAICRCGDDGDRDEGAGWGRGRGSGSRSWRGTRNSIGIADPYIKVRIMILPAS